MAAKRSSSPTYIEGISFVREFYGSLKVSEKWIWNIIFDAEMSNISRQHPENKI